jgi:hypothetical protein
VDGLSHYGRSTPGGVAEGIMDFAATAIDRAHSQRLRALQRANRVRTARAQLKRRIADGELTAAAVILSPRREIETMPIGEVLVSQRHWGEGRCRGFLAGLRMAETKTIGSMTTRQRIATVAVLARSQPVSKQRDTRLQSEQAPGVVPRPA